MGRVRPASATSEAIEAEVLLKVWDVLHPRAVGEGGRPRSSCRRQRIASCCIFLQIGAILYTVQEVQVCTNVH